MPTLRHILTLLALAITCAAGGPGSRLMTAAGGDGEWTPPDGCVLWLSAAKSGDVAALGTWADQTGNANNGTLVGSTYVEGDGGNRGAVLTGDPDKITVSDIAALGAEQTKCIWIKFASFASGGSSYLIDEGNNNNWIQIKDYDADNLPSVTAGHSATNWRTGTVELNPNTWYHIAMQQWSDGSFKVYVNGNLDIDDSGGGTTAPTDISIGVNGNEQHWFVGLLDGVMAFSSALTVPQLEDIRTNSPDAR